MIQSSHTLYKAPTHDTKLPHITQPFLGIRLQVPGTYQHLAKTRKSWHFAVSEKCDGVNTCQNHNNALVAGGGRGAHRELLGNPPTPQPPPPELLRPDRPQKLWTAKSSERFSAIRPVSVQNQKNSQKAQKQLSGNVTKQKSSNKDQKKLRTADGMKKSSKKTQKKLASPQGHLFFFLGGNLPPKSNLSRVGATESNLEKKRTTKSFFSCNFPKTQKQYLLHFLCFFIFFCQNPLVRGSA